MEYPFDALHAGIESQILNLPAGIPDSQAIRQAKSLPDSVEKFRALGKALSRQLRYREAVAAYTEGLNLEPEHLSLLRLRAGRYLTTLQSDPAIADFEKCLTLGAEKLDCLYRIGLAQYYAGRYEQAMEAFEGCMPLCDDEMGIAVLYWHTLSAARAEKAPTLLKYYRPDMAVGHHTAYEKAMERYNAACSSAGNAGEGRRRSGIWHYLVRPALASRLRRKRAPCPNASSPGRFLAQLCVPRCMEGSGRSPVSVYLDIGINRNEYKKRGCLKMKHFQRLEK